MLNGDTVFEAAKKAVGDAILHLRPDLTNRWEGAVPNNIGLNGDNWLKLSGGMVKAFNSATGLSIAIPEPTRATFRKRRLVNYVVAIANLGDRSARQYVAKFEFAGW